MPFAAQQKAEIKKMGCPDDQCDQIADHAAKAGLSAGDVADFIRAVNDRVGAVNWAVVVQLFAALASQNWAQVLALLTQLLQSPSVP